VRDDAQAARHCEIEVTELMTGAIAIALLCGCGLLQYFSLREDWNNPQLSKEE
jgi:hypothetical protein